MNLEVNFGEVIKVIEMSTDNVTFRTKNDQPTVSEEQLPEGKPTTQEGIIDIEVPYLDYDTQHPRPFIADYFNLGDTWNDPIGGFPKEVSIIKEYIDNKINYGEIANSISAIKNVLKGIEKMTNTKNEERAVVKVETIAGYIEFLNKTEGIKKSLRRYGNTQ